MQMLHPLSNRTAFEKSVTGRFLLLFLCKRCRLFSKLPGGIFQCWKAVFWVTQLKPVSRSNSRFKKHIVLMLGIQLRLLSTHYFSKIPSHKAFILALWPFRRLTFRHETQIESPDFDQKIKWSLTKSHCFSRDLKILATSVCWAYSCSKCENISSILHK